MMEGISSEAASLAGHLRLSNLCWIYDNNHITIEGNTALAFSEDVATRFIGYGWNVTRVGDANDLEMLSRAFRNFQNTKDRPTLIIVDSHIGYGAPHKQDTSGAHGEPFGEEEVRLAKRSYGWPEDKKFYVPDGVYDHFQQGIGNGASNCGTRGSSGSPSIAPGIPNSRTNSFGCSIGNFRRDGTRTCPNSRLTQRGWGLESHRRKCSIPWPRTSLG